MIQAHSFACGRLGVCVCVCMGCQCLTKSRAEKIDLKSD